MLHGARLAGGLGTLAVMTCFGVGCAVHTEHPREARTAPEQFRAPMEESAPTPHPRPTRFPLFAADEIGHAMRMQGSDDQPSH